MDQNMKKYWLDKYKQDKIGTIAKLSQAMQHMAWLREWQRIHGNEPRIKPITQEINGEKVKIGESDIAVPWSKLNEFFRKGNENGDVETVKFLIERIESGDISELTDTEIHELSEKENVKWSDGKHSLNPLQGYLYDFTFSENQFFDEEKYGQFDPIRDYQTGSAPKDIETDNERENETQKAFKRYYTTRLVQELLSRETDSKHYDFVNFDITSVTTPEQIAELDKKLVEIVQSPEIQAELERLDGNKEFEKRFYGRLREEVEIEIKKDSDRIENAYKVFVALETGNLEDLVQDNETRKWAESVYQKEFSEKNKEAYKQFIQEILTSDDPSLDEMCWMKTIVQDELYSDIDTINKPMSIREAMLNRLAEQPYYIYLHTIKGIDRDREEYINEIIPISECTDEQVIKMHEELKARKTKIKEIENNSSPELDEEGEITVYYGLNMPYYSDYTIENRNNWLYSSKSITNGDRKNMGKEERITIRTTKGELIKRGLDPKNYDWKSLEQIKAEEKAAEEKAKQEKVSSKAMIEAEQGLEKGLTTKEVGGIKGLFNKLLDKLKNFGKGEK